MSSGNVKLKFYDESSGWSDRRPVTSNSPAIKNLSVSTVDLHHVELAEVDRFNEVLSTTTPTIVLVHRVTLSGLNRLKGCHSVRKMYGVLEAYRLDGYEDFSVALLKLGLALDSVEAIAKADNKSLQWQPLNLSAHITNGPSISVFALGVEQGLSTQRRATIATTVLKSNSSTADITLIVSNALEGTSYSDDVMREFQSSRGSMGYTDLIEEALEKPSLSPWTIWMKSTKYMAAATVDMYRGLVPHHLSCMFVPRPTGGAATTIAIPMPRSAKGNSKSSSSTSPTANQVLTDPAVVSAEAAKGSGNPSAPSPSPGSDIVQRLMRQQQQQQQQQQQASPHPKWRLTDSFLLKGTEAKLSNTESNFDVSSLFLSAADAVEALNSKAFNWPVDFCVVHGTILSADTVTHCDRQSFRRYARDTKGNAALTSQMFAAINNYPGNSTPVRVEKNPWQKSSRTDLEEFNTFQRQLKRDESVRREWSEGCCTIVYQLTPREMKLNITAQVGLGKDNLKKAIYLLNRSKSSPKDSSPLHDYPYDYALLFSVERQGYWLIAATHVPCDIVACRVIL